MSDKIKIIITDDDELTRRSCVAFLNTIENFEVISEAGNGRDAIKQLKKKEPDILLLDIMMPIMSGLEALPIILHRFSQVKIIIFTKLEELTLIKQLLKSGVASYYSKNNHPDILIKTIQEVYKHGFFIEQTLARQLLIMKDNEIDYAKDFTPQQMKVLKFTCGGLSRIEIANKMNISVSGVKYHRRNIYTKTGCLKTTNLIQYAIQHHISIDPFHESLEG